MEEVAVRLLCPMLLVGVSLILLPFFLSPSLLLSSPTRAYNYRPRASNASTWRTGFKCSTDSIFCASKGFALRRSPWRRRIVHCEAYISVTLARFLV